MTTRQLEQVADAIISLYKQRDSVPPLEPVQEGTWRDQMRYRWVYSDLEPFEFETYPFVIHTIERIATLSRDERRRPSPRRATTPSFCARPTSPSICSPTPAPRP